MTMTRDNYPLMLRTLRAASPLPISVKCRIGVDHHHSYSFFSSLVGRLVSTAGIEHVIVHCRRAVLGLSPKLNRVVPPLEFEYAKRLKEEWGSQLRVEVNGGIASEADVRRWMEDDSGVDGIMIGRYAQRSLWQCLQNIDDWTQQWRAMRGHNTVHEQQQRQHSIQSAGAARARVSREAALLAYCNYIRTVDPSSRGNGTALLVRPLMSLWQGQKGGAQWRRRLVEGSKVQGLGALELIQWALDEVHAVRNDRLPAGEEEDGEKRTTNAAT